MATKTKRRKPLRVITGYIVPAPEAIADPDCRLIQRAIDQGVSAALNELFGASADLPPLHWSVYPDGRVLRVSGLVDGDSDAAVSAVAAYAEVLGVTARSDENGTVRTDPKDYLKSYPSLTVEVWGVYDNEVFEQKVKEGRGDG